MKILPIFEGWLPLIVILVLNLLKKGSVANALRWPFMIALPNFCLTDGFQTYYMNFYFHTTCSNFNLTEICQYEADNDKDQQLFCCRKGAKFIFDFKKFFLFKKFGSEKFF